MKKINKVLFLATITLVAFRIFSSHLVWGITIKEEEELSHEVLAIIKKQYEFINDPLIDRYVNRVGKSIVSSISPQPFNYHFYVLKEDVYNAFATPAGHIFIHSGLMAALENEGELAGILAHEVAHVSCRHISQKVDQSKKVNLATLAGMAAGALLGVASGSAAAAQALTIGSMAAGQTMMLAYSREDELQADQRGLDYLSQTGYDGSGLLTSLKIIRSKQWFGSGQIPTYLMTHPASEDRIAYIGSWLDGHPTTRHDVTSNDPYTFNLVRNRLIALYGDKAIAMQRLKTEAERKPEDAMAQYGYGLILARTGNRKEAISRVKRALEKRAFDPYILTDLGRIYFLDGRFSDALKILESAVSVEPQYPEALYYLAKIHMEQGDFKHATNRLEHLVATNSGYIDAYYALGETHGKQGRMGDAHYYLGVFFGKTEIRKRPGSILKERRKQSKIRKSYRI